MVAIIVLLGSTHRLGQLGLYKHNAFRLVMSVELDHVDDTAIGASISH